MFHKVLAMYSSTLTYVKIFFSLSLSSPTTSSSSEQRGNRKKTQGLQIFPIKTPPSQTGGGSGQGFKFKSWQGREGSALEESERSKSEIFDRWSKRKSRADGPEAGITEAATKFCTSVKLCRGRCAAPPAVIFNLPGFLLLLLLTHRSNFQEPASELTRRFCATARSEIFKRTKDPF